TLTTFSVPGSRDTQPMSINPEETISGNYIDANFVQRAFVRTRDGTFTTFDIPGAIFIGVSSINSAGAITGTYEGANFLSHGFLRTSHKRCHAKHSKLQLEPLHLRRARDFHGYCDVG